MPIYEYECKACGFRQEAIQKMSDDPLVDCSACNKPELNKLVSAPAFRLKGGGWYETDFKGDNKKNVAKEDHGSTKSGSSKAGANKKESSAVNSSSSNASSTSSSRGGCGSGGCGCH